VVAQLLAPLALLVGLGAHAATDDQLARGEYLMRAGNCITCHTRAGGDAFAGGLAFSTRFGTLYSTNITPDPETGIGGWSEADFERALRGGVRPNGEHLYPAFPYTAFTGMSDEDVSALYAYFMSVTPVRYTPPANELDFPYNQRWTLAAWKWMYFEEQRFAPAPAQSEQWNRGAYLVEAVAHCGACHSPRNALGAEDKEQAYTGGLYRDRITRSDRRLIDWSAPNLTSASAGLNLWSVDDLSDYLKFGYTPRAGVFGPMNKVIMNSTRHLEEADTRAMAVYLKDIPAKARGGASGADAETLRVGELQYDIHCGTCHLPTGLGSRDTGPPLVGSPITLSAEPQALINMTLHGAEYPSITPSKEWEERRHWDRMEAFGQKLSDEQAAALLTYIRSAWGNDAGGITAEQVAQQRGSR
jgi:mono/diheme cytochrome c family protein